MCLADAPFMVLNSWGTVIVVYGLAGLRYEAYAIIQFCMILSLHALISNQLLVFTIWYFDGQVSLLGPLSLFPHPTHVAVMIHHYRANVISLAMHKASGLS